MIFKWWATPDLNYHNCIESESESSSSRLAFGKGSNNVSLSGSFNPFVLIVHSNQRIIHITTWAWENTIKIKENFGSRYPQRIPRNGSLRTSLFTLQVSCLHSLLLLLAGSKVSSSIPEHNNNNQGNKQTHNQLHHSSNSKQTRHDSDVDAPSPSSIPRRLLMFFRGIKCRSSLNICFCFRSSSQIIRLALINKILSPAADEASSPPTSSTTFHYFPHSLLLRRRVLLALFPFISPASSSEKAQA